jgi:hypothetical protein
MFYMAGMALRRGFDQSFSCMHALWKKGWLRADAGFSVFHAYHTELKMALQRGFIVPLFIHACIAKPEWVIASPYSHVQISPPHHRWTYIERCLQVSSLRHN